MLTENNYEKTKETYLALTKSLLDDTVANYSSHSPNIMNELGEIDKTHNLLVSNLDNFNEHISSLPEPASTQYQKEINDTLQNATAAIKAINRQIIKNSGMQTDNFASVQYNRVVGLIMMHLQNWQITLDNMHEELPLAEYKEVDTANALTPSHTPQKVIMAENGHNIAAPQYNELRAQYEGLQRETETMLKEKYGSAANYDEITSLLSTTNKSLESIDMFHETHSTPWGQLLGTQKEQFLNIMSNSIKQISEIKNKLSTKETSDLDFDVIKELIHNHSQYIDGAINSMYSNTLRSAANFQLQGEVRATSYSKH